jgi:flagellar biosynthesis/type III secretory pathway M-ring protein FliF/YscJ
VSVAVLIAACALLVVVVAILVAPLRRPRSREGAVDGERSELEARREAKYREIRDAELDFRTGKLSHEDHRAIDATLRAEALAILDRLERIERGEGRPLDSTPRDA